MSDAYDRELRQLAHEVAAEVGYDFLKEGVYSVLGGPSFETIAECRLLHRLGADAVGESSLLFVRRVKYMTSVSSLEVTSFRNIPASVCAEESHRTSCPQKINQKVDEPHVSNINPHISSVGPD